MAWSTTKATENQMLLQTETVTLVASGTAYTSVIDFIHMGPYGGSRWMRLAATPTAITGSDLDVNLLGSYTRTGAKIELKDAVIADMTSDATEVATATALDMWLYPMPYYYVGFLADADATGNTVAVTITMANAAPQWIGK